MLQAGLALLDAGAAAVVVKGGHRPDTADDLYLDHERVEWLRSGRVATRCTHGTGCTFSAAITAFLARGLPPIESIQIAKRYLEAALRNSVPIGEGHSPVNHATHLPDDVVKALVARR